MNTIFTHLFMDGIGFDYIKKNNQTLDVVHKNINNTEYFKNKYDYKMSKFNLYLTSDFDKNI